LAPPTAFSKTTFFKWICGGWGLNRVVAAYADQAAADCKHTFAIRAGAHIKQTFDAAQSLPYGNHDFCNY
jgi:hypothetical protein